MYKTWSELGTQPQPNTDQYQILEIKDAKQKYELLSKNRVVVIDIYADWCGPCRQIAPDFATMAARYNKPGECILVKENFQSQLSSGIEGIPTFHFFLEGKKVDIVVGADLQQVENKLQQILNMVRNNQNMPQQRPNQNMQVGQVPYMQGNQNNQGQNQGPQYSTNSIRKHGSVYHGQNLDMSGNNPKPSDNQPLYGYPQ